MQKLEFHCVCDQQNVGYFLYGGQQMTFEFDGIREKIHNRGAFNGGGRKPCKGSKRNRPCLLQRKQGSPCSVGS